jgi:hypothetical protein
MPSINRDSRIVTGYDARIVATINDELGAPLNLTGATIKAAVVSSDHSSVWIPEVTCSSGASGASWATGVVVIEFTAAQTTPSPAGKALIEIQVTLAGKKTPFFLLTSVVPGLIG